MPTYRVETDQGTFDVDADREPTNDEILSALNSQKRGETEKSYKSSTGFDPYGVTTRTEARKLPESEALSPGLAIDIGLEAGIPAVAQTLAIPLTPAGQSFVGSTTSAIGNVLAQVRRIAAGEQKGFSPGQTVSAAAIGAIPFSGPGANLERVTASQFVKNAAKQGLKTGAAAVAGQEIQSLVDQQKLAPIPETIGVGILGATLGAGASTISDIATNRILRSREISKSLGELGGMAEQASPGMLLPSELAPVEGKLALRKPSGVPAQRAEEGRKAFSEQAVKLAPDIEEGDVIYNEIGPKIGAINKLETDISAVGEKAAKANEQVDASLAAIREARATGQAGTEEAIKLEVQKAADEAFQSNFQSVKENAKRVIAEESAGGFQGVNPAIAQEIKNEFVVRPAANAVRRQQEVLYAPIKGMEKDAVFETAPILAKADEVAAETSGGLPGKVESAIKTVREILKEPTASLQDLRNLRSDIYRAIDLNEFGSSNADRLMKGIAGEITAQIDSQATKVLGEEAGQQLLRANKFYSETRPIFAEGRINKILNTEALGDSATSLVNQIRSSGVDAPEYKALIEAIDATRKFDPELADGLKNRLNNTIKRSIIHRASDSSGRVDPAEMFKYLDDIKKADKSGNSLLEFGFGDAKQVDDLGKLLEKYPDASKLTSQQWDDLMSVPAFASELSKKPIATDIERILAVTQAENQLIKSANLRAAGAVNKAEKLYQDAISTAKSLNISEQEMKGRMEQLMADPSFVAWNNPKFPNQGFNALKSALFDPEANKVSNADIRELVSKLASSKNSADQKTLKNLQSAYLADKIAVFDKSNAKNLLLEPKSDEIAIFFNPANPGNKNNELERFKALFQNDPDAINRIQQFGRMARAVQEYEKLAKTPVIPASYNIPVVGEIRRGFDFLGDLYRQKKYDQLSSLLSNPREFAKLQLQSGRQIQELVPGFVSGGMGAIRGLENNTPENR
jgi:hypothetical protein